MEGRRGASPSALRGSCGIHLRMSCRKLGLATLEEGRRRGSILVGPPKPAGVAGKPASSGDGVRHRGRIMAENGGASFKQVGAPVAGCSGRCSLAPASGTGGKGKGTGGAACTVGHKATRRHQVNRRRAAAVLRNRPASIWQSPMGFATPMRKPTRRLAPVSTDHILARAAQASSDFAPGGGPTE